MNFRIPRYFPGWLFLLGFCYFLLFNQCAQDPYEDYKRDWMNWHESRLNSLKSPYGWTSVVGLYPLKVTRQYFGASEANELIIPGRAESSYGYLEKSDEGIWFHGYKNLGIRIDGEDKWTSLMKTDREEGGPSIGSCGSFQWHIIDRQGNFFLRVKDTLSPYRSALTEIPFFSLDTSYRIQAKFLRAAPGDSTRYLNELGMTITNPIQGRILFNLANESRELVALSNDETSYFVIFGDLTNGKESYGGGRFLYPEKEDRNGNILLDFNRSVNPPCVFTPYATCPFPPEENKLPIRIEAGEQFVKIY